MSAKRMVTMFPNYIPYFEFSKLKSNQQAPNNRTKLIDCALM
jgi:hypothetical protein